MILRCIMYCSWKYAIIFIPSIMKNVRAFQTSLVLIFKPEKKSYRLKNHHKVNKQISQIALHQERKKY